MGPRDGYFHDAERPKDGGLGGLRVSRRGGEAFHSVPYVIGRDGSVRSRSQEWLKSLPALPCERGSTEWDGRRQLAHFPSMEWRRRIRWMLGFPRTLGTSEAGAIAPVKPLRQEVQIPGSADPDLHKEEGSEVQKQGQRKPEGQDSPSTGVLPKCQTEEHREEHQCVSDPAS